MFSLIITVISIALVAALALATLYYGGSAFNKGSAEATASKVLLQGQQLLGAADLYYAEHNTWPSMQQLLDGEYLKSVPTGQAPGAVEPALAGTTPWVTPIAGEPVFMLTMTQQEDACAAVNKRGSLRKLGILKKAYTELNAQCYGDAGAYKVIFKKFGDELSLDDLTDGAVDIPAAEVVAGAAPISDTDPAWSKMPVAAGGSTEVPTGIPEGFSVTPALAFTETAVNRTSVMAAYITNSSPQAVAIDSYASSNPAFTVAAGTCPATLEAGQSCNLSVTYAPTVVEPSAGTLSLHFTGLATFIVDVPLSGASRPLRQTYWVVGYSISEAFTIPEACIVYNYYWIPGTYAVFGADYNFCFLYEGGTNRYLQGVGIQQYRWN